MDNWLAVFIVIALVALWLLLHRNANTAASLHANKIAPIKLQPKPYQGVTIIECANACASVQSLKEQRFLVGDVSPLPVAGCSAKKCACTYKHHTDRRSGEDRRYPNRMLQDFYSDEEKRSLNNKDRRQPSFA